MLRSLCKNRKKESLSRNRLVFEFVTRTESSVPFWPLIKIRYGDRSYNSDVSLQRAEYCLCPTVSELCRFRLSKKLPFSYLYLVEMINDSSKCNCSCKFSVGADFICRDTLLDSESGPPYWYFSESYILGFCFVVFCLFVNPIHKLIFEETDVSSFIVNLLSEVCNWKPSELN